MYKEGTKLVLTLPIKGKTMQFEQGLKGKIVEYINNEKGESYRVQFIDGRVALLPKDILLGAGKMRGE